MKHSASPFLLFSWQDDFPRRILETALEEGNGKLNDTLFVFPHLRPARYLERLIRLDERLVKPCLLPRMMTSGELFEAVLAENGRLGMPAGILDRVGLLLECARQAQAESDADGEDGALPVENAEIFFPWGVRLDALFEECLIHDQVPFSFQHLEGELFPFAAAILRHLSKLYGLYIQELEKRGWSTPGLTAQRAAALYDKTLPGCLRGRIYLSGFYSLTGTEDKFFKKIWMDWDARVLIQGDPDLAQNEGHWSCAALSSWISDWRAEVRPASLPPEKPAQEPQINFYHCYDTHSQLATLQTVLSPANDSSEERAVILMDAGQLVPVLHHLGREDLNISMGYPLSGAPLNRFLESLLAMHENTRTGGQYWKDCVRLLRQPYVKMLGLFPETDQTESGQDEIYGQWRELLLRTEHFLRQGTSYVNLPEILQQNLIAQDSVENTEKLKMLCETFKFIFIDAWVTAHSLRQLGQALKNLCALLLKKGERLWTLFPLDAECLYRFMQAVLPELEHSALAEEKLPARTLFFIFRELVKAERIPYEAYPLTAMQIMGLLESRLLHFDTVYILDATEDLLPGAIAPDPLAPDGLRAELGLPGLERRRLMQAYYFFRLLQGAKKVHLFWQEGVESGKLQESKKNRSRFIEELLWREEQKPALRRILKPERPSPEGRSFSLPLLSDGPLHQVGSKLAPLRPVQRSLSVSPQARIRMRTLLSQPVSATRMNAYLRCPAYFYYRELTGLAPLAEANEDDDPQAVGELFHEVLRDYYRPKLGRPLRKADLPFRELEELFLTALAGHPKIQTLPADVRIMLKISGPRALGHFLNHQPEASTVLALEKTLQAPLTTQSGSYRLNGRIDRLDARPLSLGRKGLFILDYKTGRINLPDPAFWQDDDFWQRLEKNMPLEDEGFFQEAAKAIPDVQLPLYLYLAAFSSMEDLPRPETHNAGWVALRDKGRETFFLPEDLDEKSRLDIIENKTELLLGYLLDRISESRVFIPRPGRTCGRCEFQEICIVL
ncbi:MAG: PD-(D/E)XK nuclease family protein [Desulfovibrionaceae bacterium]|nr:PD-(D/E)XK nuclease family protein [Desulfovibrionaceae bacterium]